LFRHEGRIKMEHAKKRKKNVVESAARERA